mmetsp:Transcript_93794/g.236369  ORF Transcript_93794/g.236369 Transcript_93794/m.236369 type:complete len:123 (+) Transcript_93794:3-371(+)
MQSALARVCFCLGLCAALAAGLKVEVDRQALGDPKGPGLPETTMAGACQECAKHAPYLDKQDECVCFATDVMGTFENDATKELTTRDKYGSETVNTGAARLAEGWLWHCRPVTATEGVWKQC